MKAREIKALEELRDYAFNRWLSIFSFTGKWYRVYSVIDEALFHLRIEDIGNRVCRQERDELRKKVATIEKALGIVKPQQEGEGK